MSDGAAQEINTEEPLVFTDAAATKVKGLIEEEGNPGLLLRVYITGGGCSGFQYSMSLEAEAQAKQQRAAQPVSSNRVDNNQPMFNSNRPSHSGGGSFHAGMLLLLLALLSLKLGREVIKQRAR